MKLDCQCIPTLPRLAWCAGIRAGSDCLEVRHGPWVEARSDRFFEGVWDGSFQQGDFADSPALFGSGARVTRNQAVFAAPSHPFEALFSMRLPESLLLSNSLLFLLVEASDRPDIHYPHYRVDLLRIYREGLRCRRNTLPTAAGNRVAVHYCCNLGVSPALDLSRLPKSRPRPPVDFNAYFEELGSAVGRIADNAADPHRPHPFRPLTMLSRGYDSVATSALAVERARCTEALTVTGRAPDRPTPADNGSRIAPYLGLDISSFTLTDYQALAGLPEAEFCAMPPFGRLPLAAVESKLEGRLLFTGDHGDNIWNIDPRHQLDDWQQLLTDIGPHGMPEFRFRVGFCHVPLPAIAAIENRAIQRITRSEEMRPWSIGGDYDRPIPRRIAENAGVPRELFGRKKHAMFFNYELSPASDRDFKQFLADSGVRLPPIDSWKWRASMAAGHLGKAIVRLIQKLPPPLFAAVIQRVRIALRDHRNFIIQAQQQHTFHWGCERIRDRYQWRD